MRHPNIVNMYGYCKKGSMICLVTEFVPGGNLAEAVRSADINWTLPMILETALSIVRGMVYIHSKNIIHVRICELCSLLIEITARSETWKHFGTKLLISVTLICIRSKTF